MSLATSFKQEMLDKQGWTVDDWKWLSKLPASAPMDWDEIIPVKGMLEKRYIVREKDSNRWGVIDSSNRIIIIPVYKKIVHKDKFFFANDGTWQFAWDKNGTQVSIGVGRAREIDYQKPFFLVKLSTFWTIRAQIQAGKIPEPVQVGFDEKPVVSFLFANSEEDFYHVRADGKSCVIAVSPTECRVAQPPTPCEGIARKGDNGFQVCRMTVM